MKNDRIIRFLSTDGVHQLYLLRATHVMEDVVSSRPLSKIAFKTLAHAICLSLLRSNNLKGASETLSFQFDTVSDLKKAIATAKSNGDVKGYVANPEAKEPLGSMAISCTADLGLKTPYHSSVFVTGDTMEERINSFFSQSDQTKLLYASNIDEESGDVLALFYHHLPVEGGESFSLDLAKAKEALKEGELEEIAKKIFGDIPFGLVTDEPVRFHCDCSKKRFEALLETLSDEDLRELVTKDEPTETTCGWCAKTYSFSPQEIKAIFLRRNN